MGETGFCNKNLKLSAVFCENLRFSSEICASDMLQLPGEAKICKNLRKKTANSAPFVAFSLSLSMPLDDNFGDQFGESLGGSQAPPSFWRVPGLPRKFPELPRKFFGDFPGSSLTVEINSNPEVPRKFPRLLQKLPGLPRKFPRLPRRSAPFSGKPDTLS